MEGKTGKYQWLTYGKDLVIYDPEKENNSFLDTPSTVRVIYSADRLLNISKIQIKDYPRVYDKQLNEVLTPVGTNLVNQVREDIVNKEILSMQLKTHPKAYKVYVPSGVGTVAIENALRRAGIEARVRE